MPVDSVVPITSLLARTATIPFVGFTRGTDTDYPDLVSPAGNRFDPTEPLSFKAAITCLPQAGEGQLWADNEFVDSTDTGSVDVDLEAIRNVHGLDTARLKKLAGRSLVQLAADAA